MIFEPPKLAADFARCLESLSQSFGVWIVGGWVRDTLLGLTPHDADFATSADHSSIVAAAKHHHLAIIHDQVAEAHGIFRLHVPRSHETFDLACLRTDEKRLGVRHAQVAFTQSIELDLSRRDLTINAMAVAYPWVGSTPEIIDPFGGRGHLQERLLCFVGEPHRRLDEDPLRLLRVARFACLGNDWRIDEATCQALVEAAPKLARVSSERVRQELFRAMAMAAPARFWQVVSRAQAQKRLLPIEQATTELHLPCAIVWLKRVSALTADPHQRLVAFFIGLLDPQTDESPPNMGQIGRHARWVSQSLAQLRCSQRVSDAVSHAVAHFPWHLEQLQGEALAQWLIEVGEQGHALLRPSLAAAPQLRKGSFRGYLALHARVSAMVGTGPWPSAKALAMTGAKLMALTHLKPGPEVGERLQALLVWATTQSCLTDVRRLEERVAALWPPAVSQ